MSSGKVLKWFLIGGGIIAFIVVIAIISGKSEKVIIPLLPKTAPEVRVGDIYKV